VTPTAPHVYAAPASEPSGEFATLAAPVWRASTVVFDSLDAFIDRKNRLPDGYTYGTSGTPTHRLLEAEIARLDGGAHCVLAPSGQAAICLTLLTLLRAGDHLLISDASYGPAKSFALGHLAAMGIAVELYPPRATAEELAQRIRPNTVLIWLESPGTVTMEVQDVAGIAALARKRGVFTAIDNTWASPLGLSPLALSVDLCIHACTKYMSGHSDVLMGSISTCNADLYARVRKMQALMAMAPSADDCYLILRGLQTMALRWQAQGEAALIVARYLESRPQVQRVLFPALPSSPDHALWQQQYRGAGCVLSLQLHGATLDACRALFAHFKLFAIGASWGGVHSLAAFYPDEELAARTYCDVQGCVIRLSIGLEPVPALLAELDRALDAYTAFCSAPL
jgi:cystathionine beta-lyase